MQGVSGQRPKRQLDDVMIELGRGVMKIMQTIDNQHGNQRLGRADD